MTIDKKKKAATAAVMQYLETERQQMAAASQPGPVVAIPDRSVFPVGRPWGMAGRNASMQIRAMMHYRALRG
jgi:hypothetical protein